MNKKRTIYQWLTSNFIVSFRNEENFALKRSFTLNYARVLVFMMAGFIVIFFVDFYIFKVIDYFYADEYRKENIYQNKLISMNMSLDSLENEIAMKDSFINNFKTIVQGDIVVDKIKKKDPKTPERNYKSGENVSDAEIKLRAEFEKTQLVSTSNAINIKSGLSNMFLFPPVEGIITSAFRKEHFGVDIVSKENEPIKSVADGTVIYSGWSKETGYMIIIQHKRELISIYKHNSALTKKVGNYVVAGQVIAIIGNTGELTSGPHLHFELWHKGIPLNPKDYILF